MGEQRTFASAAWATKKRVTKREQFLTEMNAVIPWAQLQALIAPNYPKPGRGRPLGADRGHERPPGRTARGPPLPTRATRLTGRASPRPGIWPVGGRAPVA